MTVFINDDILKEKLREFFEYAKSVSDSFCVSRKFSGKLPKEVLLNLNAEYKDELAKEDAERRERYKKDEKFAKELKQVMGIANKKQAVKYFDDLKKQASRDLSEKRKITDDACFKTDREDHLKTEYSRISAVSRGPVFESAYFSFNGKTFKEVTSVMKEGIYDYPYTLDGTEFSDLAFYKNGEFKIGINSQNRFCLMELSKDEVNEFAKIKPTHELT